MVIFKGVPEIMSTNSRIVDSLPHSRFLDVTQRSPKSSFEGALRDIRKTAAAANRPCPDKMLVIYCNFYCGMANTLRSCSTLSVAAMHSCFVPVGYR